MTLRAAAAAALLSLAAGPAAAHGGLAGGAGFLSGALHPFVATEHLVLLLGLGLLSGQLPPERRGLGFAAVGLGLLAGLAAGRATGLPAGVIAVAILASACLLGGLVALAPRPLGWAVAPVLAALAGLGVGLDTDLAAPGAPASLGRAAGVVAGAYLIVLDAAALAAWAARPLFAIGVRVAGSWIAAIAFLLLALAISRPAT